MANPGAVIQTLTRIDQFLNRQFLSQMNSDYLREKPRMDANHRKSTPVVTACKSGRKLSRILKSPQINAN
jgi:hypothetical protein